MSASSYSLDKSSSINPLGRNAAKGAAAVETVLAAGTKFTGQLYGEGRIEINGHFEGEISSGGEVVIAESAVINATINAKIARIYGRVDGAVSCGELVELKAGSCVTGNVTSPRVVMEDGVVFEGACSMSAIAAKKAATVEGSNEQQRVNS